MSTLGMFLWLLFVVCSILGLRAVWRWEHSKSSYPDHLPTVGTAIVAILVFAAMCGFSDPGSVVVRGGQTVVRSFWEFSVPVCRNICAGEQTLYPGLGSPRIKIVWGRTDSEKLAVYDAASKLNLRPKGYMQVLCNEVHLPFFWGDRLSASQRQAYQREVEGAINKCIPGVHTIEPQWDLEELRKEGKQPGQ